MYRLLPTWLLFVLIWIFTRQQMDGGSRGFRWSVSGNTTGTTPFRCHFERVTDELIRPDADGQACGPNWHTVVNMFFSSSFPFFGTFFGQVFLFSRRQRKMVSGERCTRYGRRFIDYSITRSSLIFLLVYTLWSGTTTTTTTNGATNI